jgi:3'-phosphoadenosine 5'-phosphosulfate sulfotransferase (PAPS reductase)/FAD synthetase
MSDLSDLSDDRTHVLALSGGKDSTALALRMAELGMRVDHYVITPTGNEPPEMIAHWRKVSDLLGKPLRPIVAASLQGEIRRQRMLPNHRARWCTRILKLEPYYRWLGFVTPCVSYVGLRADEDDRAGMTFPDADGVEMRFPMKEWGWTLDDVIDYLAKKGVTIPKRTDCSVCFWQKLGEWFELWRDNPEAYAEGEALEAFVTAERGTPRTFRSSGRDSWPAGLTDLRKEFEAGRVPTLSLRKMEDQRRRSGECRACTL